MVFEKFTDRARKVMALANQECQLLNHEVIGTEHLLLGLIKEGNGAGAVVRKYPGVSLASARAEVEKLLMRGPDKAPLGKLPFTPLATMAIEFAIEESRRLGHVYVGMEHLMLGLLRDENCLAAKVLANLNVSLTQLRNDVLTWTKSDQSDVGISRRSGVDISPPVNGPDAIRVWEFAREEARMLGKRRVSNGHLLLGLLRDGDGIAAKVLAEIGVNAEELRQRVLKRLGESSQEKE